MGKSRVIRDISVMKAAQGLECLVDPAGVTVLDVRVSSLAGSLAKEAWVKSKVPVWVRRFTKRTGLEVLEIEYSRPFPSKKTPDEKGNFTFSRPTLGNNEGYLEISLKVQIQGALDVSGLLNEVAWKLEQAVHEELREWIRMSFDPRFTVLEPKYIAAGSIDFLHITGPGLYAYAGGEHEDLAIVLLDEIEKLLVEYGGETVAVDCANLFSTYRAKIKWNKVIADKSRGEFEGKVEQLINSKTGYSHTRVYCEVW